MSYYPENKFDIEYKASKLIDLDLIDMLMAVTKELDSLNKMRIPKDANDKYASQYYLKFITNLELILSAGIVNKSDSYLDSQIKPIIQRLVDKKQLLPKIMDSF